MIRLSIASFLLWDASMLFRIIHVICVAPALAVPYLAVAVGAFMVHALVFGQ
jgi:hypothetical protein